MTPAEHERWSDHEVEQRVGRLLQIGVLLSAGVVVVGGAALLLQYGGQPADFRVFRGELDALTTLRGIAHGVRALDSRAIVQLGLVLLIATPVARVALTLVSFFAQRDRTYMALTSVVLGLLLFGLLWGRG